MTNLANNLVAAIVFAALGIVTFIVAFIVVDRLTPYDLWKEIIEDQNSALAILIGFVALGLALIIASAIH
jgi:putative membrane protein